MNIKLTIEEVRSVIEELGFELITEEYLRNTQRLEIRCSEYHTFTSSWAQVKDGVKCSECQRHKWNKITIQEHLNTNFEGYTVLTVCNDVRTIVSIKCPNNHVNILGWNGFLSNKNKCETCKKIDEIANRKKLFKSEVKDDGYTLIDYCENDERWIRAQVTCGNNHDPYEVRIDNFINGKRCPHCRDEDAKKWQAHSYDYVKNFIEIKSASGYRLLSKEYINSNEHLLVICDKGHKYPVNFDNFHTGYRCPTCAGNVKYEYEKVKQDFEEAGYILLSTEYVNNHSRMLVICDKGHHTDKSYYSILLGTGCNTCFYENNRGSNHASWRGGITPLRHFLRENLNEWKATSLVSTNYTCDVTGLRGRLEVHHKIPFHRIVEEVLRELRLDVKESIGLYTETEIKELIAMTNKIHSKTLGAPLLKEVHVFYHSIFGYKNNTVKQYDFFRVHYKELKSGSKSIDDFNI